MLVLQGAFNIKEIRAATNGKLNLLLQDKQRTAFMKRTNTKGSVPKPKYIKKEKTLMHLLFIELHCINKTNSHNSIQTHLL